MNEKTPAGKRRKKDLERTLLLYRGGNNFIVTIEIVSERLFSEELYLKNSFQLFYKATSNISR